MLLFQKWDRILQHRILVLHEAYTYTDVLDNAGHALFQRYLAAGHLADIDRCLQCFAKSATHVLFHKTEWDVARHIANLGAGCRERYNRVGEESDLQLAIDAAESAVNLRMATLGDEKAGLFSNLGLALYDRSIRNRDDNDLRRAIEYLEKASTLHSSKLEARSILNHMGLALSRDIFAMVNWPTWSAPSQPLRRDWRRLRWTA